jgi:hypothetical protein
MTSIPWQGKLPAGANNDGKFEQFVEYRWGVRAMIKDIANDIENGADTITELIGQYAPGSPGYVDFVTFGTGIGPFDLITTDETMLKPIIKKMAEFENGQPAITGQDWTQAWAIL